MELHVLGPTYGLPSIDAECIAAVALLRSHLTEGGWSLVPSHDQTHRLPYLRTRDQDVEGFENIRRYIEQFHHENESSEKQRADSAAISSFLASRAQTLLDISLYVSFENYTATRTAFTKILPWYANYIIPPKRREAGRKRTQHLGISSIDLDDVHEDSSERPSGFDVGKDKEKMFEAEKRKRASLLLPQRNTVRSLLRRPEHSAVFRLHALADDFFEPLQDMLGEGEYFLETNGPHAVDCLAYGYLSLMLYPQVPQAWLAETMRKKFPKLVRYTECMHERLGMQTNAEDLMLLVGCANEEEVLRTQEARGMTLPWTSPLTSNVMDVASTITRDLISRIPLLNPRTEIAYSNATKTTRIQRHLPAILAATATTLALLGYYAFATRLLVWPQGQEVHIFGRRRLADYGHLGAALAGIGLVGRQADRSWAVREQRESGDIPLRVDVGVARDDAP